MPEVPITLTTRSIAAMAALAPEVRADVNAWAAEVAVGGSATSSITNGLEVAFF